MKSYCVVWLENDKPQFMMASGDKNLAIANQLLACKGILQAAVFSQMSHEDIVDAVNRGALEAKQTGFDFETEGNA